MKKRLLIFSLILVASVIGAAFLFPFISKALIVNKSPSVTTNLNTGLVGWWTFDAKELTANTSTDKSGNGNNGTRKAHVKTVTGKIGQGMNFDAGNDDYILVPDSNSLSLTTSGTMSAWVKMTQMLDAGSNWERIMDKGNWYAGRNEFSFYFQNSATVPLRFELSNSASTAALASTGYTTSTFLNKWRYVTATWNGNTMYLYIDGVLNNQTPQTISPTSTVGSFNIGGAGTHSFHGLIDDVRVYSRALSSIEVQELYHQGASKISKSPVSITTRLNTGLTGWWTFDGKDLTVNTSTDKSGSGNNGRRTGGVFTKPGKIGQGMYFDGADDSINVPYNTSSFDYAVSGGMTMAAWIKPATLASFNFFLGAGSATDGGGCMLYVSTNIRIQCQKLVGATIPWSQTAQAVTVPLDKWSFAVGTYNYTTEVSCISLNGRIPTCSTGGQEVTPPYGAVFQIGRSPTTFLFNGVMDDVRYYNRIISQPEITQLYMMGR